MTHEKAVELLKTQFYPDHYVPYVKLSDNTIQQIFQALEHNKLKERLVMDESFYYGVFLVIDLLRSKLTLHKEMPCDDIWDLGKRLYSKFLTSTYNKYEQSEYEQIDYFLNYELRDTHED